MSCLNISIRNDAVMEELVEEFTISLESVNTDTRVRVSAQPSTVRITDDDGNGGLSFLVGQLCLMQSTSSPPGVTISMDRSSYAVSESSRKVEVCATMTGQSAINNTVIISTATGSAGILQSSLINIIHFKDSEQ